MSGPRVAFSKAPRRTPLALESIEAALADARAAQVSWARLGVKERLAVLGRFQHLVAKDAASVARRAASPLHRAESEALAAEVLPLLDGVRFLRREAKAVLADRHLGRLGLPSWLGRLRTVIQRVPKGVVLVIGPGNYPLMLPGLHIVQALAAGNAVVVKPAPLCSDAIFCIKERLIEAGLDSRLLPVLPETISAAELAIAQGVDHVIITGSSETGRHVLSAAATMVTPVTAELSGSDAMIVLEDADLTRVEQAVVFGLGLNGGQTCISPRRLIASDRVLNELRGRLVTALSRLDVPLPVASRDRWGSLVDDAVSAGARRLLPVGLLERGPIVLDGVTRGMEIARRDVPAPVLSLMTAASLDDAIDLVNACPFRLGASVFGGATASDVAARLEVGVVCVNDVIAPTADPRIPFGGRGRSGFGVTRGREGLLELTHARVVSVRGRGRLRHLEPPREADAPVLAALARVLYGEGGRSRWQGILELVRAGKAATARNNHEKSSEFQT